MVDTGYASVTFFAPSFGSNDTSNTDKDRDLPRAECREK